MALTVSQQKARVKAIDAKLVKARKLVADIEALEAEKSWYEAAPTVADRPKAARKTKEQKAAEAAAASVGAEAPATA